MLYFNTTCILYKSTLHLVDNALKDMRIFQIRYICCESQQHISFAYELEFSTTLMITEKIIICAPHHWFPTLSEYQILQRRKGWQKIEDKLNTDISIDRDWKQAYDWRSSSFCASSILPCARMFDMNKLKWIVLWKLDICIVNVRKKK